MKKLTACFLTALLLLLNNAKAQNADSLLFRQMLAVADTFYNNKSFDSAFLFYNKSYQLSKQKSFLHYQSTSRCLYYMASCFYDQKKYTNAHQFYYAALKNAREYGHNNWKNNSLRMLYSVQYLVQQNDSSFLYPPITNYVEDDVLFTIDQVIYQKADSAVVQVNGGAYDGIINKKSGEVFSIYNSQTKEQQEYIGKATIIKLTNNKTTVSIKLRKDFSSKTGYQVKLRSKIPEELMRSGLGALYRFNIDWKSNGGFSDLFNRRFLFYYFDENIEKDALDIFVEEVNITANKVAADTLKSSSPYASKIEDGISKGKNIIKALSETAPAFINYFFRFTELYNATYSGGYIDFTTAYATWVANKMLLSKDDAKDFILSDEKNYEQMQTRAKLLHKQAKEDNWTNSWIDEALEYADKNSVNSMLSYGRLLYNYGMANGELEYLGWSYFLDALRNKSFGRIKISDSLLTISYLHFQTNNSLEGMQWVRSTRPAIIDTSAITINIQSGHIGQYNIYKSPNQRYFATTSSINNSIKIWDLVLGKQIRNIDAHDNEVSDLAFSPGGRYLASMSPDSTIKIWNTYNYGLMNTFKPAAKQRSIEFTPEGNYLVSSAYDSTINFWDPFSGRLVKSFRSPGDYIRNFSFYPKNKTLLYLVSEDSVVYEYDLEKASYRTIVKAKQGITNYMFTNDGKYACLNKSNLRFTIINVASGEALYEDDLFSWESSTSVYLSHGSFTPDSKYFVYCGKDSNTVFLNLNEGKTVSYSGKPILQFVFNSNGKYFIQQEKLTPPTVVDVTEFDELHPGELTVNQYKEYTNFITNAKFTKDDRAIIFQAYGTHELDLTTGSTALLNSNSPAFPPWLPLPENDSFLIHSRYLVVDTAYIYNKANKETIAQVSLPSGEAIASYSLINNNTVCLLAGEKGGFANWDIKTKKLRYYKPVATRLKAKFDCIIPQIGLKRAIVFGHQKTKPFILNIENGKLIDSIAIAKVNSVLVMDSVLFITSDSNRLFIVDANDYSIKKIITIGDNTTFPDVMQLSKDGKTLFILSNPYCYRMDIKQYTLSRFLIDATGICSFALSHDDSMMVFCSFTGQMLLYHPYTGKLISKIYQPLYSDCIIMDRAGHYIAPKQALQAVVFNYGNKAYSYDQFDLQLNQPHLVLAALGKADTSIIKAYENAYKKRLKKTGLASSSGMRSDMPGIILLNRTDIKPITTKNFYNLSIKCFDLNSKLAAIKISVNDVPIIDSAKAWSFLDTVELTTNIRIPLISGKNSIKVYCINKAGISSLKEVVDIFCNAKDAQNTYFIGLGVNNYADKNMALTYSVKDVKDLAVSFKKIYPDIIIDTLLNEKLTIKNIEALKQRLTKVKVSDRVIMVATGHGLLSDSLDFYYATYDVDFKNPAGKGLSYDALENIINSTAARQKLLLIDACHSGMLDKEALIDAKNISERNNDNVKAKPNARSTIKIKKSGISLNNSFDLMQTLFSDFSDNNGTVVISAAGGLEYAFESRTWNNGVFTYCIRKGIEDKEADMEIYGGNNDRKVSVQELQRYVSKKVPSLTHGQQRPTSRKENLDFDWDIR